MAFLSLKKKSDDTSAKLTAAKELKVVAIPKSRPAVASGEGAGDAALVLLRPRVTEKASVLSGGGRNVYVFEVSKHANKKMVSDAITELYKVVPEKIAVLKIPVKRFFVKGKVVSGTQARKAYVYLKPGEQISNP